MNRGGIAQRLIDFAKTLVGSLPGGLAHVNIIASMLFGAISGSAPQAPLAWAALMTTVILKAIRDPRVLGLGPGTGGNGQAFLSVNEHALGWSIPPVRS